MEIQVPREKHFDAPIMELRLQAWPHPESDDSLTIRKDADQIVVALIVLVVLPCLSISLQMALVISPSRVGTGFKLRDILVFQLEHNEFAGTSSVAREMPSIVTWQGNPHIRLEDKSVPEGRARYIRDRGSEGYLHPPGLGT
ncbi:MAG: hypothetical protein V2A56_05395 [bacterium]